MTDQSMGGHAKNVDGAGAERPALAMPVSPAERYEIIDIIRGFALFGVLLANMVYTMVWFASPEVEPDSEPVGFLFDEVLMGTFIDFKFYTLFTMLFGLGFAMQFSRASTRGENIVPTYLRRLIVLFLFGVFHAIFIWFGDVLHMYALLGIVLLLFRKQSDATILKAAIVVAMVTLLTTVVCWIQDSVGHAFPESPVGATTGAERFEILQSGSWLDVVRLNAQGIARDYTSLSLQPIGMLHWYLSVLWKFLFGFYIGRRMLLQRAGEHARVFRRVLPWALVIGLAGNAILGLSSFLFGTWIGAESSMLLLLWIPIEVGIFALSMAYLCGLVLLHQKSSTRWLVAPLAPVGRMALTNYLTHSVLFVVLFYGVGFGLIGKVHIYGCMGISAAIFAAQMVFSSWWLRRFRFGPMEWLWRCLTYGKLQSLRLSQPSR